MPAEPLVAARPRPTPRVVLRVTLALAGALLLVRTLPPAVAILRAARAALTADRATLAQLQADLDGMDALADTTRQLQARLLALAPALLTGRSAAEAQGDLAGRLTLATDRAGVRLTSTEPVADSLRAGDVARVAVRLRLEGDARGLAATLGALARDPGALSFDALRIVALDPASGDAVAERLRVELVVRGWHQVRRGVAG